MDEREIVRWLALGRVAAGVAFFLFPRRASRAWTGHGDPSYSGRLLARGLAGRDAAIGVGILQALENDDQLGLWLEAGAMSDAVDGIASLASFREMGGLRDLLWTAISGSSAYLHLRCADTLD